MYAFHSLLVALRRAGAIGGRAGLHSALETRHSLAELLTVAVCAVLCVADDFVDIALWGRAKLGWLRGFLRVEADIPSHDTFGRVFGMFDAQAFQAAFLRWWAPWCPYWPRIAWWPSTARRAGASPARMRPAHCPLKGGRGIKLSLQPLDNLVSQFDKLLQFCNPGIQPIVDPG